MKKSKFIVGTLVLVVIAGSIILLYGSGLFGSSQVSPRSAASQAAKENKATQNSKVKVAQSADQQKSNDNIIDKEVLARTKAIKLAEEFIADLTNSAADRFEKAIVLDFDKHKLIKTLRCRDDVFCRRVYIDLIGTLPTAEEAADFIDNRSPDKRQKLIDALLQRKEFAWYWSLKWCDHLRIKSEFPIKLWPNAVACYSTWVTHALEKNMPYDKFARALLTTSGSNFREPPVNFYRAIQQKTPAGISDAVTLTFMGTSLKNFPKATQKNIQKFFSRVKYKKTVEWKEEIVINNPAPVRAKKLTFPDGSKVQANPFDDRRILFANWLITKENKWFATAAVNRIWFWIFEKGLINPPDNCNKKQGAIHARILKFLTTEFVRTGYDSKHIIRLIVNSSLYQQSWKPIDTAGRAKTFLAAYPVRRLDAEVIIDAINQITGSTEKYFSIVPEPFTFIPESHRTIQLQDGTITSEFLNMFGRPSRDTGLLTERNNKPSISQQLFMLNSTTLGTKINRSKKLKAILRDRSLSRNSKIEKLYLTILSRRPTTEELKKVNEHFKQGRSVGSRKDAFLDIVWALLNTREFLYRH